MPLHPPASRIQSKTQASDLQRLAYDTCCKLSDDLRKCKSVSQTLKIARAVEKLSRAWQAAHTKAYALRQPHGRFVHRANGSNAKPSNGARPARPGASQPTSEPVAQDVTALSQPSSTLPVVVAPVEQRDTKTQS